MKDRIPRGFEFALGCTALLWAVAASILADRSARGLSVRFGWPAIEPLLTSLFVIFLVVLGFQLLEWIVAPRNVVKADRQSRLRSAFPLPRRPGFAREWALGAALGWGACLVAVLPVLLSGNLHGHLGVGLHHPGDLAVSVLALLATALAAELVFRGYVFVRFSAAFGAAWASVCTSVLFAAVLVWAYLPQNLLFALLGSTLFGLVLASAFLRTEALWLSWGVHFSYRAAMLLLLGLPAAGHASYPALIDTFATGPHWLTGGGFGLDAALLTAPVLLLTLLVLNRTTRDYAWRYTYRPVVGAGYEVVVPPPKAHAAMEAQAPPPLVQILPTTSTNPTAAPPREQT